MEKKDKNRNPESLVATNPQNQKPNVVPLQRCYRFTPVPARSNEIKIQLEMEIKLSYNHLIDPSASVNQAFLKSVDENSIERTLEQYITDHFAQNLYFPIHLTSWTFEFDQNVQNAFLQGVSEKELTTNRTALQQKIARLKRELKYLEAEERKLMEGCALAVSLKKWQEARESTKKTDIDENEKD